MNLKPPKGVTSKKLEIRLNNLKNSDIELLYCPDCLPWPPLLGETKKDKLCGCCGRVWRINWRVEYSKDDLEEMK